MKPRLSDPLWMCRLSADTLSKPHPPPAGAADPGERAPPSRFGRKLRVFWLIKGLGLGGAERLLCAALPYLDRDTFDYEVGYFLPWKNALVPQIEGAGIPVTCFGARSGADPRVPWRVLRHVRAGSFDVIHAHLPLAGIAGRIAARLCRVPVMIYTEHGLQDRMHRFTRWVNRRTLRWNDLTIAVSDEVAASIRPRDGEQVRIIHNGVDCRALDRVEDESAAVRAELAIPAGDFVVANVANLSPVKRHEVLIRAFSCLQQGHRNATLLLVGQLRDRQPLLQQLAERLGVGHRVRFTGPRTDVARLVKAADVFAMSSRSEGLPIALLEAMALARPVVCTAVGGIPKVVDDGCEGYLVSPERPEQMAERLGELARQPHLRESMGRAGRLRVETHHDVSLMVRRVEQAYRRVLEKKGIGNRTAPLHA